MKTLLKIQSLSVSFSHKGEEVQAVRDISFEVQANEVVGIVGESGCGKSVTMQSILGLLRNANIRKGSIYFEGKDLLVQKNLQYALGKEIGFVFQDPFSSLHPTISIGKQVMEGMVYHQLATKNQAKQKAIELLSLVGIPSAKDRFDHYPYQFSGGQRQRIMIAIALSCSPKLLIADEPTTALDGHLQLQILHLLKDLQKKMNMTIVIISHDIGVIAKLSDRIFVMYAGKILENGSTSELLRNPLHPYTKMLLHSLPKISGSTELNAIEGSPPSLINPPKGCPFADRCPHAMKICVQPQFPKSFQKEKSQVACWLYDSRRTHEKDTAERRESQESILTEKL